MDKKQKKKEISSLEKLLGGLFCVAVCTGFSFVFIGLSLELSVLFGIGATFFLINSIDKER